MSKFFFIILYFCECEIISVLNNLQWVYKWAYFSSVVWYTKEIGATNIHTNASLYTNIFVGYSTSDTPINMPHFWTTFNEHRDELLMHCFSGFFLNLFHFYNFIIFFFLLFFFLFFLRIFLFAWKKNFDKYRLLFWCNFFG